MDILEQAIRALKTAEIAMHYGKDKQVIKAIEESAEWQQVLAKYANTKDDSLKEQIIDELADNYIMLSQMVCLLDLKAEKISEAINRKLDRQLERIKNE